jgi:3-methyladenine DNA glycosylase AlkD
MSFEEVFAQLEAWGSEATRKIYARQGAGENQFGVQMGPLRGLARKLKSDHPLAMQLWATGNVDAMVLATMLMSSDQLSEQEVEEMVRSIFYYRLLDELTYNAVAKMPFADSLREKWTSSPQELIGRAGWNLYIARILNKQTEGLHVPGILSRIEAEMAAAPKRKQDAMNRCLVEIGTRMPDYTERCIAIGEKLGRLDDTPVPRGCVSSYAPEWIAAVLKRSS